MSQIGMFGKERGLVILNMGLGRDLLAMLCLLVTTGLMVRGRLLRPSDVDAVVFADTGAEWRHTYDLIPEVTRICAEHGLRFVILQKPGRAEADRWVAEQGELRDAARSRGEKYRAPRVPWAYRGEGWAERAAAGGYHLRPAIADDFGGKRTIATRTDASCTHNHKILPIRRFMEDLARELFGEWATNRAWGRQVKAGAREPHLNLIGYAADERGRLEHGAETGCFDTSYSDEAYPLIEMGIAKADEEPILRRCDLQRALKSGCWLCPHQPLGWFWVLRETDPTTWGQVVEYERRAIERAGLKLCITGRRPIADQVDRWRELNPRATVASVLAKTYNKCSKAPAAGEPRANPFEACSLDDQQAARAWVALGLEQWAAAMRDRRIAGGALSRNPLADALRPQDVRVGAVYHVPDTPDGVGFDRRLVALEGGQARVSRVYGDGQESYPYSMPAASFVHHVNDLRRTLPPMPASADPAIDAVISGRGEYIGKGNDGLVWGVGPEVVKVSTTTPYVPENPGHRTPEGAVAHLRGEHEAHDRLQAAGVPFVPMIRGREHAGRYWLVKPRVDVLDLRERGSVTRAELDALYQAVLAMHDAGLVLGDELQAGRDGDGRLWFIDLGQVRAATPDGIEHDLDRVGWTYSAHGWSRLPQGAELRRKYEQRRRMMDLLVPKMLAKGRLDQARKVTREWVELAEALATELLTIEGDDDQPHVEAALAEWDAVMDLIDEANVRVQEPRSNPATRQRPGPGESRRNPAAIWPVLRQIGAHIAAEQGRAWLAQFRRRPRDEQVRQLRRLARASEKTAMLGGPLGWGVTRATRRFRENEQVLQMLAAALSDPEITAAAGQVASHAAGRVTAPRARPGVTANPGTGLPYIAAVWWEAGGPVHWRWKRSDGRLGRWRQNLDLRPRTEREVREGFRASNAPLDARTTIRQGRYVRCPRCSGTGRHRGGRCFRCYGERSSGWAPVGSRG